MIEAFILWFFSVGCVVYILYLVRDVSEKMPRFKHANVGAVLRGLFGGLFLWPYILWISEVKSR